MKIIFDWLDAENNLRDLDAEEFAKKAAHFIAELNAIHPFREGNGRTQNIFLSILADEAGHPLNLEKLESDQFLRAMIESFSGREEPLALIIRQVMRAG
jgi:cell filamentation protein